MVHPVPRRHYSNNSSDSTSAPSIYHDAADPITQRPTMVDVPPMTYQDLLYVLADDDRPGRRSSVAHDHLDSTNSLSNLATTVVGPLPRGRLPASSLADQLHMLSLPHHSVSEQNDSMHSGAGSAATESAYAHSPPRSDEQATSPAAPMILPHVPSGTSLDQRPVAWSETQQALEQRYPQSTPSGLSLVSHYLPGKTVRPHRLGSRRHRGRSLYTDQLGSNTLIDGKARGSTLSVIVPPRGGAFRRSTVVVSTPTSSRSMTGRTASGLLGNPLFHPPDIPAASALNAHKTAAGRAAWGPDGGGNPALGAGGYEDDDGVDIGPRHLDSSDPDAILPAPTTTSTGLLRRTTAARRHQNQPGFATVDSSLFAASQEKLTHDEKKDASVHRIGPVIRLFGGLAWRLTGRKHKLQPLRWNKFKWTLVAANTLLTCYAIAGLVGTILTWTHVWARAEVVLVSARTESILSTVAATTFFISAIVGWCGILLNNRAFLTAWNILLWVSFGFLVAPGYIAYKKHSFNLEGKTNELWSRNLNVEKRRTIQNTFSCCGYYNPMIEASESNLCYARSALPGCKGRFLRFERKMFRIFYTCAFSLVAPHLVLIVIGLLCSNHVTYRFGKGLTPHPYQLDATTAWTIKNDFLEQLSRLYGPGLVRQVLELQSRSLARHRQDSVLLPPALLKRGRGSFGYLPGTPQPSGTAAHTMAHSIYRAPWKTDGMEDEDEKGVRLLLPPNHNAWSSENPTTPNTLSYGPSTPASDHPSTTMTVTSSSTPWHGTSANRLDATFPQH